MSLLAIVIPAFKAAFLDQTLESLAAQTKKDFFVYIGNDAGDAEIGQIVNRYTDRLNIIYRRFEYNLGSVSLVKQWQRCLEMVQEEEWIWILPDDDFADPQCVERFCQQLEVADFDLFRFNVHFVDADGVVFKTNPPLPLIQDVFENLLEKLSFSRASTVAEFIFKKRKLMEVGGFAEIPLAWGSDDLLCFIMGVDKGIYCCNNAFVYLRQSDLNISNNYKELAKTKVAANFSFFDILQRTNAFSMEMVNKENRNQFSEVALKYILYNLRDFSWKLQFGDIYRFAIRGNRIWGGRRTTEYATFLFE